MTGTEYKQARERLGLSQGALAKALAVTRATINRRETIPGRVTLEAQLALKALAETKEKEKP
jgi:DNA-binding XRE family transcriptional regulator